MDGKNWRAAQGQVQMPGQVIGGEPVPAGCMEGGDWRTQLQQDSRQRIVDKIMETLKRHLPFSGQEGLQELKKIAVRFEEKIYTAATSQSDYLRKVSLKMLKMETKSQNPMANPLQSNAADSSSQKGSSTGGDWQEDIYQKIKSMHEMYYPDLNEMYKRMAAKLQQHDAHPQQPKNEQLEKLRFLKLMLERLIMFLRTNKNDIQPNHKEKIVGVEKQIVNILNSSSPRKSASSLQQGHLTQPHMHAMQQTQQQQPQMHSNEGQMNSQMQPMNIQSSMPTQQNNLTSLQHNTLSSGSSVSNSRQNILEGMQSGSNMDAAQATTPSGSVPVQKMNVQNMYNATPFAPMMQGWPTNSVFPFGQSQIQSGQQQIMQQSLMQSHIQQQQKMNLLQLNLQELMQQQRLGLQQQSNTSPNLVVSDQSQVQQQLLPPNIQNNNASTVVLNSTGLTPIITQSHMQPQQKQYLLQPNQPMLQPLMSPNQLQLGQKQQQLYLQQQANTLPIDWQQRLQSTTGPVLQPQSPIDQKKQSSQFQSQSERGTNSKSKKKTVTALKKTHAMQLPQMPPNEGQVNSQTQAMNIQSSMVMPTQQHNALSSNASVPNSRPNMLGELQSGSNIDLGQSNVLNQIQQVTTNSLQQNLVGDSQPLTRSSISSQNGLTALQSKAISLQSNSNAVQSQQINPLQQMFLSQQYQQSQMLQQHMQHILLQHQKEQQIMHQLMQHLVQKQQQQQQTLQKQSAQQLIQQRPQTSQKQSEQQLIQKPPPAPHQQQQTSQKQSAQHVIQLQEQISEMPSGQQMMRITAFLKLVCHVLIVVLLIMLMMKIGGMFLTQSFTGSYYDA